MHYILARITVKPEAASAARDILQELVVQSRKEPGCVSYDLYQQTDTPHLFQTVEQWQDQSAANQHMKTAHFAAAVAAAGALFAAPPEILAFSKLM